MKRRSFIILSVSALLAACKEESGPVVPEIRLVRTVTVERAQIDGAATAVGEIRPQRDIDLSFRVSGKLTERLVDVGQEFKVGEVLARIDAEDYENRLKSADGDVAAAKAVLVEAQAQEGRTRKLFDRGYATHVQLDGAVKSLYSAKAKLESAVAALKLAEAQLAYTEIRAEFDGVVTATSAEEGQVIGIGQLVLRVAEPTVRDAVFDVADATFFDLPETVGNARVRVSALGHPEISVVGTIREISPVADATTRTYQVRVGLVDAPTEMRFGTSVNGKLEIEAPKVVVLPASALFDDSGVPAVWIVDRVSSKLKLRKIKIDHYAVDRIVVASGLTDGDVVVAAGVHTLRENQRVALNERTES
jgi:RND family efflux transporter MFP subunit